MRRILFSALMLAGGVCIGLFERLSSTVAPDGHLEEPFFLLPLGWALILLGGAGLAVSLLRQMRHKSGMSR